MYFWLTLLGMGLITYAIRLAPILALERFPIPPRLRQALRFVAPAVLSALVFPALFRPHNVVDISFTNLRLLAGLFAILVAWRTRNVLLTIALGMGALWGLQWLFM
jgi:branched-subunit amino acid transport protein